jgi:8-oxo-dGTP pyrophosphatase MutT (NUDIX family)
MQPAIPAATLILLRDRPGLPPELPMIERGAHLAFAANRMVFPGGRVDEDDYHIATRPDLIDAGSGVDIDELAHRITAIRETIEEIGLAPAMTGIDSVERLHAMRAALHAGKPFSAVLSREGCRIDPHLLLPFARWRPDLERVRRFDTRFYIARAPDLGEAVADGQETSHCLWGSAADHLAAGAMIFPTVRNLERLAQLNDFAHATEFLTRYSLAVVTPWIEERDGVTCLCIPEGLGYPVTAEPLAEVERGLESINASITRTPG